MACPSAAQGPRRVERGRSRLNGSRAMVNAERVLPKIPSTHRRVRSAAMADRPAGRSRLFSRRPGRCFGQLRVARQRLAGSCRPWPTELPADAADRAHRCGCLPSGSIQLRPARLHHERSPRDQRRAGLGDEGHCSVVGAPRLRRHLATHVATLGVEKF